MTTMTAKSLSATNEHYGVTIQDRTAAKPETGVRVGVGLCQGVYDRGMFHSDFNADNAAHERQLLKIPSELAFWKVEKFVFSGGFTKQLVPISEAESTRAFYRDVGLTFPKECEITYDCLALDTAENIILGLMQLRRRWGGIEFGTIVLLGCHTGKCLRVFLTAEALGLSTHIRYQGFTTPDRLAAPNAFVIGEAEVVARLRDDPLAFAAVWESKRRSRYHHPEIPYDRRLDSVAKEFPRVCCHLQRLRGTARSFAELAELRQAFADEVMQPHR